MNGDFKLFLFGFWSVFIKSFLIPWAFANHWLTLCSSWICFKKNFYPAFRPPIWFGLRESRLHLFDYIWVSLVLTSSEYGKILTDIQHRSDWTRMIKITKYSYIYIYIKRTFGSCLVQSSELVPWDQAGDGGPFHFCKPWTVTHLFWIMDLNRHILTIQIYFLFGLCSPCEARLIGWSTGSIFWKIFWSCTLREKIEINMRTHKFILGLLKLIKERQEM